jgi:beta-lactamase regulating signal transducer with metallopeptidase domain
MIARLSIFSVEFTEALGWMLIHSLWQGTIVAILLLIILFAIKTKSAQIKYFISFVALMGITVWAGVTFVKSYRYAAEKQALKAQIINNPSQFRSILKASANGSVSNPIQGIDQTTLKVRAFFIRHFNSICIVWLIGIMIMLIRFVGGLAYTRRLRSHKLTPITDEWYLILKTLSQKLGVKRRVESFFSPLTKVPVTLGVIKPVILLPVSAVTGLTPSEFEAIVAHELAHIMRNDYLLNVIQSIVEMLFFFHPAVWIISSQIRAERENSCDNIAVDAIGNKTEYIKTLAAMQIKQVEQTNLAVAFSGGKGSVLQRIKRLQKEIAMKTNFSEGIIAATIIAGGLMLASFTSSPSVEHSTALHSNSPMQQQSVQNRDSLVKVTLTSVDKLQPEQVQAIEKAVEVAMSETDTLLSAQMMYEINQSLKEIDVNEIVKEAMQEVAKAMQEASVEVGRAFDEVEKGEINREMKEAAREIQEARKEMEIEMRQAMAAEGVDSAIIEASVSAAKTGMDVASVVVENLDVEGIVSAALQGVFSAFSSISQAASDSANAPLKSDSNNARTERLEMQNKELLNKQAELEKKLKELEGQTDKSQK